MLNDSEIASPAVRRNHRTYTPEFKTELVADCQRPGASIAAVATLHGINANVLHRWIKENRLSGSNRLTAQPAPPWTCAQGPIQHWRESYPHLVQLIRTPPTSLPIRAPTA